MSVSVKVYSVVPKASESIEDAIGRDHAKYGRPVEVRITEGNNTNVLHLSTVNARALLRGLERLKGRNEL